MSILILTLAITGTFFAYRFLSKRQTRKRLLASPLSAHQRAIIREQVPLVQMLPSGLRAKLEGKINLFLHQVDFYGCNGMEITKEMELSVAAQACLLVVNSDAWYEDLLTVLLYPGAFTSLERTQEGYVVTEEKVVRIGESWVQGPVILSWPHSEGGALNHRDGQNVVMHEFAHQIDSLSGRADGTPLLSRGQSFADWERVFLTAYDRHIRDVEKGRKTVLDAYGAEGIEEFFAVAVEAFFEKPVALKRDEPGVYEQLLMLFRLNPVSWGTEEPTEGG